MDLLLLYGGIIVCSYLLASRLRQYSEKFAFLNTVLNCVAFGIVLIMGLRMGANDEIISQLGTIGLQASAITVFVVGGSILFVSVTRRLLGLDRYAHFRNNAEKLAADSTERGEEKAEIAADAELQQEENGGTFKFTLGILAFVLVGMAAGYYVLPELVADIDKFQSVSGDLIVVGLCMLLAIIGFNMGLSGQIIKSLKAAGLKIFLFPLAAISGSIAFGALYGLISPLTVREAMAISAGFGWYTFAPSVITDAGHVVAGAVSFMHNIIRETLGIVMVPVVARIFGYIESTSITGVAAMDICMPIVEKACNEETVIYSFAIGVCMNICVPVLVPLIIG